MARALVAVLALLAAAAGWWYFAPHTLPAALRQVAPGTSTRQPAPVAAAPALYKWRDARGQLNVTDVPPKDRPYETVRYDPNTNVVPGYTRPADNPATRPIPPDPAARSGSAD